MAHKQTITTIEEIGPWQVRHEGSLVVAVSHLFGDKPNDLEMPFPLVKGWGPSPVGNWYATGDYGTVDVGFVFASDNRVELFPTPYRPFKIALAYERDVRDVHTQ